MEELKINGIVLKSNSYKDNDKLLTIFSVELGKITVFAKGVNKPNSKHRYACVPFSFGEWELVKSGDFFVLKTVDIVENFYDLTLDYDKLQIAYSMLELCDFVLKPNIISEDLFIDLLNNLKILVYENINYELIAIKFYLKILKFSGYGIAFDRCSECGNFFTNSVKFNKVTANIVCDKCDGISFPIEIFYLLADVNAKEIKNLENVVTNSEINKRAIKMLLYIIEIYIGYKIKSLKDY